MLTSILNLIGIRINTGIWMYKNHFNEKLLVSALRTPKEVYNKCKNSKNKYNHFLPLLSQRLPDSSCLNNLLSRIPFIPPRQKNILEVIFLCIKCLVSVGPSSLPIKSSRRFLHLRKDLIPCVVCLCQKMEVLLIKVISCHQYIRYEIFR